MAGRPLKGETLERVLRLVNPWEEALEEATPDPAAVIRKVRLFNAGLARGPTGRPNQRRQREK